VYDRRQFLTVLAAFVPATAINLPLAGSVPEMLLMVHSKDATRLAVYCQGSGSTLLLVHGGSGDHTRWEPAVPAFSARFRVCAMDRRGHGQSGDAQKYSFEREFEDVATVADSLDRPVSVIGHSFGAICAAEAALRTRSIEKLVLYEPPFPVSGPVADPEVLAKFEDLVQKGQKDAALEMFLHDIVKLPDNRIEEARKEPGWAARANTIDIQVREIRAVNAYEFAAAKFEKLKIPTLLVMGSQTADHHRVAIEALSRVLPNRTLVTLQGQGHDAIQAAPQLFTDAVLGFLKPRPLS
jgi:pimeloyl-ACP methyl ester carboxylesterase